MNRRNKKKELFDLAYFWVAVFKQKTKEKEKFHFEKKALI